MTSSTNPLIVIRVLADYIYDPKLQSAEYPYYSSKYPLRSK